MSDLRVQCWTTHGNGDSDGNGDLMFTHDGKEVESLDKLIVSNRRASELYNLSSELDFQLKASACIF